MEPIHIIVEEMVEPLFDFNWMELIEFLVGTLSTIISIGVMIIGIRAINRLQQKGEDAVFNFLSRFSVYLELLKDMIGTSEYSVYFYKFTDDLRKKMYAEKTPSEDQRNEFIDLSKEIMDFLKESDNQFAITEDYFLNRKKLLRILINNVNNLGRVFPYNTLNTSDMEKEISNDVSIINNLLDEINNYTSITLNHYWKKIKKRYKSKKVSSNNQAGLCQKQDDNFSSDDSNSGNEDV